MTLAYFIQFEDRTCNLRIIKRENMKETKKEKSEIANACLLNVSERLDVKYLFIAFIIFPFFKKGNERKNIFVLKTCDSSSMLKSQT